MKIREVTPASQASAKNILEALGWKRVLFNQVEIAHPAIDWFSLILALDRIFLATGGAMGQAAFLRTPVAAEGDRLPAEVLLDANGPERFCQVAHRYAAAATQRKRIDKNG